MTTLPSNPIETDILVVGAGPVGLFTVFEAGLLGLKCHLIDNLDKVGGQCAELYPEKPIYDIPGVPGQTAQEHVDALVRQIKPFEYQVHLKQRVEELTELAANEHGISSWQVRSNTGTTFVTKNVFIAAGSGAFEPRKPTGVANLTDYEGAGVAYAVRNRSELANKRVVIFGGGDSALDWSVELAQEVEHLTLVHRRDAFRGSPATEASLRKLVAQGDITLKTPYVPAAILSENDAFAGVQVRNFQTNDLEDLPCDQVIYLLGLHKKLGPILNWNLDYCDNKKIRVNTENFMSSVAGIFAVGDINHYPGKMDLILCGFHETTLACQGAYNRIFPGERVPFGYTTTNPRIHQQADQNNKK